MSGSSFRWPTKKVCIKHLCTQDLSGSLTGLYKNIYIFFVLCFCLLLHRLAVRIRLPFHIFLQV